MGKEKLRQRARRATLAAGRIIEHPNKVIHPKDRVTKLALHPLIHITPDSNHDFKPNPSKKSPPITLFRR